jgi:hypothetical protein
MRTDRVREPPNKCVRNGRLLKSLLRPENSQFFKLFSLLNCVGKDSKSGCCAGLFGTAIVSRSPEIAKFPVKFPVSREFARRLVRIPLRRQPTSPALKETVPNSRRNARQWRAFSIQRAVSSQRISRIRERIRRKSLVTTVNIPVFGRRVPETGFDRHCVTGASWIFSSCVCCEDLQSRWAARH